jgi:predicted GH43/DUF377 family glycosyl hydrolase
MSTPANPCHCPAAGFCELYGLRMSARAHAICSGQSGLPESKAAVYRGNWARAKKPGESPSLIQATDCDYRGEVLRRESCQTCNGKTAERPVFACSIHGECSLSPPRDEAALLWIEADKADKKPPMQFCTLCREREQFTPTPYNRRRFDPARMLPSEHQFNNSVIEFGGRKVMAYRRHWNGACVVVCEIGSDGEPANNNTLKIAAGVAQEDPRLFVFRGRLHVAYTVVRRAGGKLVTDVGYSRLIDTVDGWQVEEEFLPKLPGRQAWEKNWGFFEHDGVLYALYSIHPWRILLVVGDGAQFAYEHKVALPGHDRARRGGASPTLHNGEWYAFAHDVVGSVSRGRQYTASVYTFEAAPPFAPLRATARPTFAADPTERWAPHTPQVIYPSGAYFDATTNRWHMSYGAWDKWAETVEFDGGEIEQALTPLADPYPLSALPNMAKREGLQLLITSYGGSGLSWLTDEIGKQRRVKTPVWRSHLCHWPPLGLRLPTLVLFADPVIAWESMRRRGILQQNARAMLGMRKDDPRVVDPVQAMTEFFDRWTAEPGAVVVRYEDLPGLLPGLWAWLGLRGSPPGWVQRDTQSPTPGSYPAALDDLRERWAKISPPPELAEYRRLEGEASR